MQCLLTFDIAALGTLQSHVLCAFASRHLAWGLLHIHGNPAGFSYDWDREVSTTSPEYYKWTQWIFCQLFKRGLAYQAEVPVNWCPALGTVLANEEVIDGKSERGDHPVVRLPMKQASLPAKSAPYQMYPHSDRLLTPSGPRFKSRPSAVEKVSPRDV